MPVATLPMYDFPEIRDATDALWAAVVDAHGPGLPPALAHGDTDVHVLWHDPAMAVSQACGWPLVDELDGVVRLIGAFAYDVPTGAGPRYRSHLVVRAGERPDPATATAAVNSFASLSGWLSLVRAFPELDGCWPGDVVVTGAHVDSLATLQQGTADVAAIDAVTYALVERHRPHLLDGLERIGTGPLIPCTPLIANATATDEQLACLQRAFGMAVDAPAPAHRHALSITAFHPLNVDDYEPVRHLGAVWQGARS